MNRYTVERRFKKADGTYCKYTDFRYAKGIKEVRELCGNIGRAKSEPGVFFDRVVYTGTTDKMTFRVVNCGRWEG